MILLPHVRPEMLHAAYWLDRCPQPDAPVFDSPATLEHFNAHVRDVLGIPAVLDLPDALPAAEVRARIPARPESARYDVDGTPIPAATWAAIEANMALDRLPDPAPARFALVTRYVSLRALPTDLTALKTPADLPFDRLQETTLDMGWPVAVLHTSADGAWVFGLTPGYWGWVRTRHLAFAGREQVRAFLEAAPRLMVQAPWGGVALPGEAHHRALQMATSLPLLEEGEGLRRVQVPRTDAAGRLALAEGYIASNNADWCEGRLPATLRTVITQAFRPLGEPYGWGGMCLGRPGRDCSRLTLDAWASAGVVLPRNSGDQGRVGRTAARFAPEEPHASRLRRLAEEVPPGALLLLPGHVMLYLGTVAGIPYALHDLWGYVHPDGRTTRAAQVVVSALPPEPGSGEPTLLERLTHAQVIAPV